MNLSNEMRVLEAHGLTPGQWSVLFAASYYSPLPVDQLAEIAAAEAGGRLRPALLVDAIELALDRGWLTLIQGGLVLTDRGLNSKDAVAEDLAATHIASAA